MVTAVAVVVILAAVLVGTVLIRRLTSQHDERIADFPYSEALPGVGRSRGRGAGAGRKRDAIRARAARTRTPASGAPTDDGRGAGHPFGPDGDSADPGRPPPGAHADVRILASSPDAARKVAQVLRDHFASTEQRSYPVGTADGGTRLLLTVDTARAAQPARTWLASSRSSADAPASADGDGDRTRARTP